MLAYLKPPTNQRQKGVRFDIGERRTCDQNENFSEGNLVAHLSEMPLNQPGEDQQGVSTGKPVGCETAILDSPKNGRSKAWFLGCLGGWLHVIKAHLAMTAAVDVLNYASR